MASSNRHVASSSAKGAPPPSTGGKRKSGAGGGSQSNGVVKSLYRPRAGEDPLTAKRFKFMSLADRLREVDVSATFKTAEQDAEQPPEEVGSFFNQKLIDLRDMDLSGPFRQFDREVAPLVASLNLLLFNRDQVVALFAKYLAEPGSLAQASLLSLVSALARDLRQEIQPCFSQLFGMLVNLIDPADVEGLESVFSCLSFLFKYLARILVGSLAELFQSFRVLLHEEHKPYIRQFASESFAFLMRKAKPEQLAATLRLVFADAQEQTTTDGISALLFETVKGVQGGFHSRMDLFVGEYIAALLHVLKQSSTETLITGTDLVSVAWSSAAVDTLEQVYIRIFHWSKAPNNQVIEEMLVKQLDACFVENVAVDSGRLALALRHTALWVLAHRGTLIFDSGRLTDAVASAYKRSALFAAAESDEQPIEQKQTPGKKKGGKAATHAPAPAPIASPETLLAQRALIDAVGAVVATFAPSSATAEKRRSLLGLALQTASKPEPLAIATLSLSDSFATVEAPILHKRLGNFWSHHQLSTLSSIAVIAQNHALTSMTVSASVLADLSTEFSALVASPLMAALAQWSATEELLPASCAKLYAILQIVQKLPAESVAPSLTTALLKLPKLIVASLSATMSTEGTNVSHTLLASTLRVLAKVLPSSSKDLVAVVREVVHTLFANVPSTTAAATATTPKSAKKAKAAAVTATEPLALEPFDGSHLFQASSLEALLSILEQDTFAASSILSGEERIQLVQASIYSLQAALSSHQRRLRLASVQLERWLVKGLGISTLDTMLELAVSVDDNGDADLGNYRNKLLHIGQFHERVGSFFASTGSKSNDAIPNVVSLFSPLPSLFLLGVLKTPFSHVWSLAIELLSKEANARPAVFWSLVVPQLQSLQAKYEQQLVGSAEEQAFQKLEHLVESAREQLLPLSEADKAAAAAERSERETSTTKNWKRSIAYQTTDKSMDDFDELMQERVAMVARPALALNLQLAQAVLDDEPQDRYNEGQMYSRLWDALSQDQLSPAAERVSRQLVPLMLDFASKELSDGNRLIHRKAAQSVFVSILSTLAKWKNPKALYRSSEIRQLLLRLLSSPEDKVQARALDALLMWKDKSLQEDHVNILKELLNEQTFRDQLTRLIHSPTGEDAWAGPANNQEKNQMRDQVMGGLDEDDEDDGDSAMDIVPAAATTAAASAAVKTSTMLFWTLRILYGKMQRRNGSRRTTIIAFVSALNEQLVAFFCHLLAEPFLSATRDGDASLVDEAADHLAILTTADLPLYDVPRRVQVGFLNVLADVFKSLGVRIRPFLPLIMRIVLEQCTPALSAADETSEDEEQDKEEDNENDHDGDETAAVAASATSKPASSAERQLRTLVLRRLLSAFQFAPTFDWTPFLPQIFDLLVTPRLARLTTEHLQSPSALVLLLMSWSASPATSALFLSKWSPEVLPSLLGLLRAPLASMPLVNLIVDTVDQLITMTSSDNFRFDWLSFELAEESMENKPFGVRLIESHLPLLLDGLGSLLQRLDAPFLRAGGSGSKDTSRSGGSDWNLIRRILDMLARLSQYMRSPELASRLVSLLLPALVALAKDSGRLAATGGEPVCSAVMNVIADVTPLIPVENWGDIVGSTIVWQTQAKQSPEQIYVSSLIQVLSPLLTVFTTQLARLALLRLLESIAQTLSSKPMLELMVSLQNLNSTEGAGKETKDLRSVDVKPDWSRRLTAFNTLGKAIVSMPLWLSSLALHSMLFALRDEDELASRNSATHILRQFIYHSTVDRKALVPLAVRVLWPGLLQGLRRPHSSDTVRGEHLELLGDLVRAFSSISSCTDPSTGAEIEAPFAALVPLLHVSSTDNIEREDDEGSFFVNYFHLQAHRRVRAVHRLAEHMRSGTFSNGPATLLTRLFQPLLVRLLLESDKASQSNLLDEAVKALEALASLLQWGAYYSLVRSLIGSLVKSSGSEKILLKALVAVLHSFHFDLTAAAVATATTTPAAAAAAALPAVVEGEGEPAAAIVEESAVDDTVPEVEDVEAAKSERILKTVLQSLLPDLRKHLIENERSSKAGEFAVSTGQNNAEQDLYKKMKAAASTVVSVRAPLAMAMVHVLQALPLAVKDAQIPWLITTMVGVLRSRTEEVREAARTTLISIAKELGPRYLSFIAKELESLLQHGYRRHVLVYTIHAMLLSLSPPTFPAGSWDSAASITVTVFLEDLLGDLAQEKEVSGITVQTKEAKAHRGHDGIELLSRSVSFGSLTAKVLQPLVDRLQVISVERPDQVDVLREAFRRVSLGVLSNPLLTASHALLIVQGFVSGQTTLVKLPQQDDPAVKESQLVSGDTTVPQLHRVQIKAPRDRAAAQSKSWAVFAPVLAEFALRLMSSALKKTAIDFKDGEQAQLVLAIVAPLVNCLNSRNDATLVLALKTLSQLLTTPVWQRRSAAPQKKRKANNDGEEAEQEEATADEGKNVQLVSTHKIVEHVMKLLSRSSSAASDVAQGSFKVLTALLKSEGSSSTDAKINILSNDQLTTLLKILKPELEVGATSTATTMFALLRSIVGRRLMSESIYDIMTVVSDLLVRSQLDTVRNAARSLLVSFILNYPLGPNRLQGHIDFLIRQVADYEYEGGRTAVMETIASLVEQLPSEIFQEQALLLLMALTATLTHDQSSVCRESAAVVIKAIFGKMDDKRRSETFELMGKWWQGSRTLQRSAAQLTSLAVDALGASFAPLAKDTLEHVLPVLLAVSSFSDDAAQLGDQDEDESFASAPSTRDSKQSTWWEVVYYSLQLVHRVLSTDSQSWAPSTLLASIFDCVTLSLAYPHAWVRRSSGRLLGLFFSKTDPATLRPLQKVQQATPPKRKKQNTAGSASADDAPCFVWGAPQSLVTILFPLLDQLRSPHVDVSASDQLAKNFLFVARCLYLHPGLHAPQRGGVVEPEQEHDDEEDEEKANSAFQWLVQRLAHRARVEAAKASNPTTQRSLVFRWMAGVSTFVSTEALVAILPVFLHPLLLASEETSTDANKVELKGLAQEVQTVLQRAVTTPVFVELFQSVRSDLSQKRADRKQKRAFDAVIDPEKSAKRKQAKNLAKRALRQRKAAEFANSKTRIRVKKASQPVF